MNFTCTIETPLGKMLAAIRRNSAINGSIGTFLASNKNLARCSAETEAALCGLWFIGQKHFPLASNEWEEKPDLPIFKKVKSWLEKYFSGKKNLPSLPLAPEGTDFQQIVWKLLLQIPYGETSTYGGIAKIIAKKKEVKSMSAQAVGGAVGRNPISIIIPCHRVVASDGSLTGYAGGISKKKALLELEMSNIIKL